MRCNHNHYDMNAHERRGDGGPLRMNADERKMQTG